jgi:hypothetical protein
MRSSITGGISSAFFSASLARGGTVHNPHDVALLLYARGFTLSREEAHTLVKDQPDVVATLLGLPDGWEMLHEDDKAHPSEWGTLGEAA